jgi:hypothetical protein
MGLVSSRRRIFCPPANGSRNQTALPPGSHPPAGAVLQPAGARGGLAAQTPALGRPQRFRPRGRVQGNRSASGCAICEDCGLLPAESLKRAFEHHDPYNPRPVWLNFRGLFRAIDEGNAGLNIPAYNGGLFAPDPALDALQVPDEVCAHFKDLGDYDYRPAREVAEGDENTEVRSVIDGDIALIDDPRVVEKILWHFGASHDPSAGLSPPDAAGPCTCELCNDVAPTPDSENLLTD